MFCQNQPWKIVRSKTTKARLCVPFHRIETAHAWETPVQALRYVQNKSQRNRLQILVTQCESEGGIAKAAALDIRYHKDCWKVYYRPVWQARERHKLSKERSILVTKITDEAFK